MAAKKKTTTKKAAKTTKSKPAEKEEAPFSPQDHLLVPKHEILSEKQIAEFFEQYDVQPTNLPTIYINDAALKGMDVKIGDIIKITRKSLTAGTSIFYRRVAYE